MAILVVTKTDTAPGSTIPEMDLFGENNAKFAFIRERTKFNGFLNQKKCLWHAMVNINWEELVKIWNLLHESLKDLISFMLIGCKPMSIKLMGSLVKQSHESDEFFSETIHDMHTKPAISLFLQQIYEALCWINHHAQIEKPKSATLIQGRHISPNYNHKSTRWFILSFFLTQILWFITSNDTK